MNTQPIIFLCAVLFIVAGCGSEADLSLYTTQSSACVGDTFDIGWLLQDRQISSTPIVGAEITVSVSNTDNPVATTVATDERRSNTTTYMYQADFEGGETARSDLLPFTCVREGTVNFELEADVEVAAGFQDVQLSTPQGVSFECMRCNDEQDDPPSVPDPGPHATSLSPERAVVATVDGRKIIIVPGNGEMKVHDATSGEVEQTLPAADETRSAVVLDNGAGALALAAVDAAGALVRSYVDGVFSQFGQVLFVSSSPNITDISPVVPASGSPQSAILTNNTTGEISYLRFDEFGSATTEGTVSIPENGGARAVSAVAPSGESPVLVAVDGTPGKLHWVDTSESPAVITELSDVGNSPRLIGCSADGDSCFVPIFGGASVVPVDTSVSTPVIGSPITVGAGPISVSVTTIEGKNVAAVAGFSDNSLTYIVEEEGGPRTVSETLSDCSNPGHAVWLDETYVVVTCNADDTYVVRRRPASVPTAAN